MDYSVQFLVNAPFSSLSNETQIKIVRGGRLRPSFTRIKLQLDTHGAHPKPAGMTLRLINDRLSDQDSLYDQIPWLTGCQTNQRLYCWPCLLFGPYCSWNTCGVDGHDFVKAKTAHEKSVGHIQANLAHLEFSKKHFSSPHCDARLYDSLVQRNHQVLRRITDVTLFVLLHKNCYENYKKREIKDLVARSFPSFPGYDDIAEDAAFLAQGSSSLVNGIIEAVSRVVKLAIKKEVEESEFLSVIISGHQSMRFGRPLRSTVMRFLKNGRPCERFLRFNYIENKAFWPQLFSQLQQTVIWYRQVYHLLAVALDGTFCGFVDQGFRNTHFNPFNYIRWTPIVPSHLHRFWNVMTQVLMSIDPSGGCVVVCGAQFEEVHLFFKMTETLLVFLQEHSGTLDAFLDSEDIAFLSAKISVSQLDNLTFIQNRRLRLLKFLDQTSWRRKANDIMDALAFKEFLSKFSTVFWLTLVIRLLKITKDIHEALDGSDSERTFSCDLFHSAIAALSEEKDSKFDEFLREVTANLNLGMAKQILPTDVDLCRTQFDDTLEVVLSWMTSRLGHLKRCELFTDSSAQDSMFASSACNLFGLVGNSFPIDELKGKVQEEILDLNSRRESTRGLFTEQLLEYLTAFEFRRTKYPNLIRLASMVLTLPVIRPKDQTPIIDRIEKVLPAFSMYSADITLLCIERQLLQEIRRNDPQSFYERVIGAMRELHPKMIDMPTQQELQ